MSHCHRSWTLWVTQRRSLRCLVYAPSPSGLAPEVRAESFAPRFLSTIFLSTVSTDIHSIGLDALSRRRALISRCEVLHNVAERAMPSAALDDAADRATPNHLTPEAARGEVPDEL